MRLCRPSKDNNWRIGALHFYLKGTANFREYCNEWAHFNLKLNLLGFVNCVSKLRVKTDTEKKKSLARIRGAASLMQQSKTKSSLAGCDEGNSNVSQLQKPRRHCDCRRSGASPVGTIIRPLSQASPVHTHGTQSIASQACSHRYIRRATL